MIDRIHTRLQEKRRLLFTLVVLSFYFLYLFYPFNCFTGNSIIYGFGLYAYAVVGCFYLYFRGAKDGPAQLALVLLVAWIVVSRVLCGDRTLKLESSRVCCALLALSLSGLGLLLSPAQRRRLMIPVAGAAGAVFTALACVGLYALVTRRSLLYPIGELVTEAYFDGNRRCLRLSILSFHPNIVGLWFVLGSALLLHLALRARSVPGRLLLSCALALNYFALAATQCRSGFVGFSVGAGLFAALLGRRFLPFRGKKLVAALALLFLVTAVLCYKSFGVSNALLEKLGPGGVVSAQAAEPAPDAVIPTEEAAEPVAAGMTSKLNSSERIETWLTLPCIFRQYPSRLLCGCLDAERMLRVNELMAVQGSVDHKDSFHNTYLEILNYLGIPGLLCLLAYAAALVSACVRLCLAEGHSLAMRALALPVVSVLVYCMFESLLFTLTDYRSTAFFLLAGVVLGEARDISTCGSESQEGKT